MLAIRTMGLDYTGLRLRLITVSCVRVALQVELLLKNTYTSSQKYSPQEDSYGFTDLAPVTVK
jgi:hypothetical protein